MSDGQRLHVAVFPFRTAGNPYLELLHDALGKRGVELVPAERLAPRWAWRARRRIDVVHLHWIEWLFRDTTEPFVRGVIAAPARASRMLVTLWILKRAGVRLVWTVHNVRPHEPQYPALETAVSRSVARLVDSIVVHSDYAARRVSEVLATEAELVVAPHGHYISAYPSERRSRSEIRRALGLPSDAFVYLLFGQVRGYKDVPGAIEAFRALPERDARLVIAGRVHPSEREVVSAAAAGDERVVFRPGVVPDEHVEAYHLAADAAVLNYAEVFSSGALLLALSYGLPVVVPSSGAATEITTQPAIEPFHPGGLTAALEAVRSGDREVRATAARAAAADYSWERMADQVLIAYGRR